MRAIPIVSHAKAGKRWVLAYNKKLNGPAKIPTPSWSFFPEVVRSGSPAGTGGCKSESCCYEHPHEYHTYCSLYSQKHIILATFRLDWTRTSEKTQNQLLKGSGAGGHQKNMDNESQWHSIAFQLNLPLKDPSSHSCSKEVKVWASCGGHASQLIKWGVVQMD